MKNKVLPLLSVIALTSCSPLDKVTLLRTPESLSHEYSWSDIYNNQEFISFRNAMNDFGASISEKIIDKEAKDDDNFVVSPLSIEMALSLAASASNGETRNEITNALRVTYEELNKNYKNFFNHIHRSYKDMFGKTEYELSLCNSIWIDKNIQFKDSGLDTLRDDYYCYSYQSDFRDLKATKEAMKDFINQKTKGLLSPDLDLSPETIFVLMNVLYLKDLWNPNGSDLPRASEDIKFTNYDKTISNKRLLVNKYVNGRALHTDNYSAFYTVANRGTRLYFIKPNGKSVKGIFTYDNIKNVISDKFIFQDDEKMEEYHTRCIFPEYEANGDIDILEILQRDCHINKLFDFAQCDFSNVVNGNACIEGVKQVAKLKVDKKGIEGAAVTYMPAAGAAGPGPYTLVYEDFIVDQAFGFVVTDYNGNIIFTGTTNSIDK